MSLPDNFWNNLINDRNLLGYVYRVYKPITIKKQHYGKVLMMDIEIENIPFKIVGENLETSMLFYNGIHIVDSMHLDRVFGIYNYEQQKEKDNFI